MRFVGECYKEIVPIFFKNNGIQDFSGYYSLLMLFIARKEFFEIRYYEVPVYI